MFVCVCVCVCVFTVLEINQSRNELVLQAVAS